MASTLVRVRSHAGEVHRGTRSARPAMTDHELAQFLGIADDERWPRAIAKLDPKKRASYERMAKVTMELQLWEAGLGPKPKGVIVCRPHRAEVKERA